MPICVSMDVARGELDELTGSSEDGVCVTVPLTDEETDI
ncbi:hypothetical protein AtDm6_0047 [Acetobacter tropicalis]|uniref:Uncharacterized protein n=1 Tax=Acetobacter tropicalis TaxID=104102 RepID=A0A095BD14_9PROT|nr:hypothetical protein AtDm6_0047 [Acetobacter tropicalis]